MPGLDCPHCGANRWPDPGENPKTPVISRCGNCGKAVNIDELAVQAIRKQLQVAVNRGEQNINQLKDLS